MDPEEYAEAVLSLVERVPRGRVTTYRALADALHDDLGGGPRTVARVMAAGGAPVPWWRVVRADGTVPGHLLDEARQAWREEGTPLRGNGRVDVAAAYWGPGVVSPGELSYGVTGATSPV